MAISTYLEVHGRSSDVAEDAAAPAASTQHSRQRPLWLTRSEAETLLAACVSSSYSGGESDLSLFHKLGEYMHSFRQPMSE